MILSHVTGYAALFAWSLFFHAFGTDHEALAACFIRYWSLYCNTKKIKIDFPLLLLDSFSKIITLMHQFFASTNQDSPPFHHCFQFLCLTSKDPWYSINNVGTSLPCQHIIFLLDHWHSVGDNPTIDNFNQWLLTKYWQLFTKYQWLLTKSMALTKYQ